MRTEEQATERKIRLLRRMLQNKYRVEYSAWRLGGIIYVYNEFASSLTDGDSVWDAMLMYGQNGTYTSILNMLFNDESDWVNKSLTTKLEILNRIRTDSCPVTKRRYSIREGTDGADRE